MRIHELIHFFSILKDPNQRKYALIWLKSCRPDFLFSNSLPWMTFSSIEFLTLWLNKNQNVRVFEYGSGGSTLFWLKHGSTVVSIEHDLDWYRKMQKFIGQNTNIDYRYTPPQRMDENKFIFNPEDPESYVSSDLKYINYSFEQYVCQIEDFPDDYFDIISIDGRARPSCILHSVKKVKKDHGILIVDNADRSYYFSKVSHLLLDFKSSEFKGVCPGLSEPTQTNIYM